MNLDFDTVLCDDFLVKMDIATMANSLEGRSPFLSKEILEYVPALPDNYKIQGKTTKYMLRKLAAQYLPAELINQPKRGFEIPLKKWVDNELNEILFDYLSANNNFYKTFVTPKFVENLLKKKIKISMKKEPKFYGPFFHWKYGTKKFTNDN